MIIYFGQAEETCWFFYERYRMLLSIIIVAKDEEQYIQRCLESIMNQLSTMNGSDCEIIFVDSLSVDRTVEIATEQLKKFNSISYKVVPNKGISLSKGWNIGIQASSGNYVLRPDAHAELSDDYIKTGLALLEQNPTIDAVGSVLETEVKGNGEFSSAIKFFLTSSVGMGNSNFRVKKESGYFDTVLYAIYRRTLFTEDVGFFNESLHRHEDTEMHGRMITANKKLFTSNKMIAVYYARDSLKKLSKQMYMNGYFSYEVSSDGGLQIRHHIPGIFYGLLFILFILSFLNSIFFIFLLFVFIAYLLVIAFSSFKDKEKTITAIFKDVFVVALGHSSYAFGYFKGIIKRYSKKLLSVN